MTTKDTANDHCYLVKPKQKRITQANHNSVELLIEAKNQTLNVFIQEHNPIIFIQAAMFNCLG